VLKGRRALLTNESAQIKAALADDAPAFVAFGETFVDYIVQLKRCEIGRFLEYVTDWEHREYFEMY
jgi:glutamine synthetase